MDNLFCPYPYTNLYYRGRNHPRGHRVKVCCDAVEDITGVSSSQVEMNSGLQFYDGITTEEIQQILIKSAADLISLDAPNYTYVASRLLLYSLRKQIFHNKIEMHYKSWS